MIQAMLDNLSNKQPLGKITDDDTDHSKKVATKNIDYGIKNNLYEGIPSDNKVRIPNVFHSAQCCGPLNFYIFIIFFFLYFN